MFITIYLPKTTPELHMFFLKIASCLQTLRQDLGNVVLSEVPVIFFPGKPGKLWEIWEKHGKTYGKMLKNVGRMDEDLVKFIGKNY